MNKTNAEKLLSDADIFAQHIVSAIDCLDQSNAMDRIFSDPKYLGAYREAPRFYRTAYLAMLFRAEMEVYKLFDQKGKSFDSFKNELARNGLLRTDNGKDYKDAKKEAKNDIETIRLRRNKVQAHSDAEFFNNPDVFVENHAVQWSNIRNLLDCMLKICDWAIICCTQEGIGQTYSTINSDDFVQLFN